MTFNSWEFLIFYPIVALLYFVLPKKLRWPMLLIASYYFYMFYQASLVILIALTTVVSFYMSKLIEGSERTKIKKLYLAITLITCLGILFFFKYFNFLSETAFGIVLLFGLKASPVTLNLILPVGISFYTFQTLSYVIDVYRGDVKTEKNIFFYALFVSFFPQLVAGPIERPDNLIPQLKEEHKWSNENFAKGVKHMLVGFFKKICVADMISVYVDSVYNDAPNATALGVIIATLLFAVQIYCDFSGYTDIATGCARIMGIRLMKNFDHPYTASSIKEFWSRWHISLSGWFKDYLYIPLGGNRCSRPRHLLNLFIVFLVSGLWHGASLTFVVWGAMHGIYQIIGTLTVEPRNRLVEKLGKTLESTSVIWVRRVLTFLLVSFAWIFFRANTIADAVLFVCKLFAGWGGGIAQTLEAMKLDTVAVLTVILSIGILLVIDRMLAHDDGNDGSDMLISRGAYGYFVLIIAVAWLCLLATGRDSSFIYFQF